MTTDSERKDKIVEKAREEIIASINDRFKVGDLNDGVPPGYRKVDTARCENCRYSSNFETYLLVCEKYHNVRILKWFVCDSYRRS